MFGLSRDNVSGNALMVGVAMGVGLAANIITYMQTKHQQTQQLYTNNNNTYESDGVDVSSLSKLTVSLYFHHCLHLFDGTLSTAEATHTVVLTLLLLAAAKLLYNWFLRPFEYFRNYGVVDRSNAVLLRGLQLQQHIPAPYPNAWFKVADSFQISRATPYETDAVGHNFVLFRAPSLNPWHLSEGSLVVLDKQEVKELDPIKHVMKCKEMKTWPCCELNHMVFVWYHAADAAPLWDIPIIHDIQSMRYHGKVQHEIACHIQEIPENGADTAHLNYIHGDFLLSWFRTVRHSWTAEWKTQAAPNSHIALLDLTQRVTLFGLPIPGTTLESHVNQVGPGLVQLIFPTLFGRIVVIETITPIYSTLQRANNVVWADKTVPRFFAKFFLSGLVIQFERDLPIWNFKLFLNKPLIVKEDGPILRYRRWMKQFYKHENHIDPPSQDELEMTKQ